MSHERFQEQMQAAAGRSQPLAGETLEHIKGCEVCAAYWDRLSLGMVVLEGDHGLSQEALRRLGDDIIGSAAPVPRAQAAHPWRWTWTLAPLAMAAGVILWVGRSPTVDDGFTPRGTPPALSQAELTLFCLHDGQVTSQVRKEGTLSCASAERLGFALQHARGADAMYGFVLGLTAAGEVRWYHPRPEEKQSVALPKDGQPMVLPAIQLGVHHPPGTYRVRALFSARPLTVEEVEHWPDHGFSHLPEDVTVQEIRLVVP